MFALAGVARCHLGSASHLAVGIRSNDNPFDRTMTASISFADCLWLLLCTANPALCCWILYAVRRLKRSAANEVAAQHTKASLADLLHRMEEQRLTGDFSEPLPEDMSTEVGQIAAQYNRVLVRAQDEIKSREDLMRALRAAEEKYRSIFENAVEGIFQTTPDGRYLSANPTLARIYGYQNVGELTRSIRDIQLQLYVDPLRRLEFAEQIQNTGIVRNFESQVFRADGGVIWISENARAILDEQGNVKYYEGTVEDISERKQNKELRLQQAVGLAERMAESECLVGVS
jgi:Amt family ammonium transporter